MEIIIGIGIVVLLFLLFCIIHVLNKKTPIPEGCEPIDEELCHNCANTSCTLKKRS